VAIDSKDRQSRERYQGFNETAEVVPFRKDHDSVLRIKRAIRQIRSMIEEMPYITEHLSSLRQEIADLRNLNARFTEKGDHTALDQTALELRTNRLREIKQELSQMLNRPDDPKVWWERARRGHLQA
jgi:hypothetical protein